MKSLASNSSSSSSSSLARNGGGGGASAQLSHTEVAAVRQLIAGYRESAAFLLRSADELENLILQQNWTDSQHSLSKHTPSSLTWSSSEVFRSLRKTIWPLKMLEERKHTASSSFCFHIISMRTAERWRWISEGHCGAEADGSMRSPHTAPAFNAFSTASLCLTAIRSRWEPSISEFLCFRYFKGGITARQSSRQH